MARKAVMERYIEMAKVLDLRKKAHILAFCWEPSVDDRKIRYTKGQHKLRSKNGRKKNKGNIK